ncbi:MAG: PH domain-containing protein [Pseudomonadota bacterium]
MRVFKSKIDAWLLAILVFSTGMLLYAVYAAASQGGPGNIAVAIGLVTVGAGLPIWLFAGTKYVVTQDVLRIKSGPFSWTIELSTICSVVETRNPISSPALSLDRLEIKYADGRSVLVSPADKSGFRAAIGQG